MKLALKCLHTIGVAAVSYANVNYPAATATTITTNYPAATATTTYSCPSGGSLSGTTCSYAATATTTDGTAAYFVSTPFQTYGGFPGDCGGGGTWNGNDRAGSGCNYPATTGSTTYSCPSGGTLSGTTCSYAATASTTYSCNGEGTYNGTGTAAGSCGTYSTTTYSCNGGGTYNGTGTAVGSCGTYTVPTTTVTYTNNATGCSAITGNTATSSPGGGTGTGASPITVAGLTPGTAYTFKVTATNANGTSAASAASNSVTP